MSNKDLLGECKQKGDWTGITIFNQVEFKVKTIKWFKGTILIEIKSLTIVKLWTFMQK